MKYSLFMLFILVCFSLTGCFEKKTEDEILSGQEAKTELQQFSRSGSEDLKEDTKSTTTPQNIISTEKDIPSIGNTSNSQTGTQTNTSSLETVQEQQEIIQDAEEDLEKLFRDIMPSE